MEFFKNRKMKYQLTYEDALKMCEAYKNFNFFKSEHMFGPYKAVTFNYFLCEYNYFVKPLEKEPHINGRDMRGVTFVFNEDGTLYKRFLMLEKFFNVNQVEETQIHLLKAKKITNVTSKEDGSLIAFMNLPNGEVFAKTQGGFTNEQSKAAMQLYHTQIGVKEFIDEALLQNYTPLFEYVSFDNRIVLKYTTKELRLIGLRENIDADFYSAVDLAKFNKCVNIPSVKSMKFNSLDEIEELMKTAIDMEGVVVEFDDGQMVKWKTAWYFNLHGIRTVNIFREDFVIKNYLLETLDDATQELNMTDDADAFKFIEYVKKAVMNWSDYIENEVDVLYHLYVDEGTFYHNNYIKFATDKHREKFFGLAKVKIERPEIYMKRKLDYMIDQTKHLMDAKRIVEKFSSS